MTVEFLQRKDALHDHDEIPVVSEDFCFYVLKVGRSRARRLGMTAEAADNCARWFLVHLLKKIHASHPPGIPPRVSEAWVFRCADNWARNERRRLDRLWKREITWLEFVDPDGCRIVWQAPANAPSPEQYLLEGELRERLMRPLARLTTRQRDLFDRHFLQGESIQELAVSLGSTPLAIRQALWALRGRLRVLLKRQGLTEQEALEYRAELSLREP